MTSKTFIKSGYYFLLLIPLAIIGFWKTYFGRILNSEDFEFYVHFHFITVALWVVLLVAQPILIRKKNLKLHRILGKLSFILFPILLISVVLLAHSRHSLEEPNLGVMLFLPFKDIILLLTAFFIAIRYKKEMAIHARGMIATGIVFIEPALARLLMNYVVDFPMAYIVNIIIIYCLLGYLIFRERKATKGRFVFPTILGIYVVVHALVLTQVPLDSWNRFCNWFIALPLT